MGQISQVMELWHERMEHYGHAHEHVDLAVGMDVYVAPTMEEADSDLIGLEDEINAEFTRIGNPRNADGTIPEGFKHWAKRDEDRLLGAERARKEGMLPLTGTPEVVCERIENLRSKGIKSIRGTFGKAGLEQGKALRCIQMFAEEVMPNFVDETGRRRPRLSLGLCPRWKASPRPRFHASQSATARLVDYGWR